MQGWYANVTISDQYVSEMMQDRAIVIMEGEYETSTVVPVE